MKDYSKEIRLLRQALGLTRAELADLCGLDRIVIKNLESYQIKKHQQEVIKVLKDKQAEAIKNIEEMATAIKNINFDNEEGDC
ncbi:helix-turn-helix domain-containing protein [Clostridium perfringens]|uniref:helix-turn-helix domain-containing protein n=1 Tax=Clostridium perfringens TaxID=1502 RepID=UPI0018E44B27|nr:helix-turn-helix transcriptional regulator [Clostridium perfringens]MBI6042180.1 helix-turn-helix domain-containing protein [Clostridium perfringens]